MLIKGTGRSGSAALVCLVCGKQMTGTGGGLEVCPDCIKDRWEECRERVLAIHSRSRKVFELPTVPPRAEGGLSCNLCLHECRMGREDVGYCGVRTGDRTGFRRDGRSMARVSCYYDPLPTNCVADWVCSGGTGAGYPRFAHDCGTEVGFYNLAVFFEGCNFNCLYCQNWSFKKSGVAPAAWRSVDSLVQEVSGETSCVCFFGGDPIPQLPYALRAAEAMKRRCAGRILRFCWETNLSMHPAWLKPMARLSLESGGCIKADIKAWNPRIHEALCGCDNRRVLDNFSRAAEWASLRQEPPLLVASTVLVPGYVGEEEVYSIASFIAGHNPDIPYALLAFAPHFCLEDFPTTSRNQAEACLNAAKEAGLRRVRLGNRHLIH